MVSSELINVSVVPASPGYRHIGAIDFTGEDDVPGTIPLSWLCDIVAWRIETYQRTDETLYSFTTPVTLQGAEEEGYIQCPNGVIDEPHNRTFETFADFINYMREKENGANT